MVPKQRPFSSSPLLCVPLLQIFISEGSDSPQLRAQTGDVQLPSPFTFLYLFRQRDLPCDFSPSHSSLRDNLLPPDFSCLNNKLTYFFHPHSSPPVVGWDLQISASFGIDLVPRHTYEGISPLYAMIPFPLYSEELKFFYLCVSSSLSHPFPAPLPTTLKWVSFGLHPSTFFFTPKDGTPVRPFCVPSP